MQSEILDELRQSKAFMSWRKPGLHHDGKTYQYVGGKTYTNQLGEKHWSVADIAKEWGVSQDLIRDLFRDEDGVLVIDRPGTRTKRAYSTMRVPESVLTRVYNQLSRR